MPPRRKSKRPNPGPPPRPALPSPRSISIPLHPLYPTSRAPPKRRPPQTTLTLTPHHSNLIWTIRDFLTPSECRSWISHAHTLGFSPINHPATPEIALRHNLRAQVWSTDLAARIWRRLQPLLPPDMAPGHPHTCYHNIRLYCYQPGHSFGKHVDESVDVDGGGATGVTVLVYLNDLDDGAGGETVFYRGPRDEHVVLAFKPVEGAALLHGHGDRCLTHEARAVTSGAKYVLRTDVVYT